MKVDDSQTSARSVFVIFSFYLLTRWRLSDCFTKNKVQDRQIIVAERLQKIQINIILMLNHGHVVNSAVCVYREP